MSNQIAYYQRKLAETGDTNYQKMIDMLPKPAKDLSSYLKAPVEPAHAVG